ncbi:plasmid mobilization protein [Cupriavidus sp. BIC8F]|uniref:plasmid mobilization protein n=1 Tax=Cupriavidus sp. BIC8F TaxID=3079014 RepID=UPI00396750BA
MADVPKSGFRNVVAIRLSQGERTLVERRAAEVGLPMATFIRQAALGVVVPARPEIPAVNREAYLELARVGSNLNQVAHHLNAGTATGVDESIVRRLAAVTRTLARQVLGEEQQ